MKKITLLTTVFTLFCSLLMAQNTVSIGTESVRTTGLPIDPFYMYSYSQNIYLASEIGQSGDITQLTYKVAADRELNSSNEWIVYVAHTTKTEFDNTTDWVAASELTQVYSGTFTHTPGADVVLTFNTPFSYNGTDNLLIAVEDNQTSYDSGSDDLLASAVSGNRAIMYRHDTNNPDPSSPPTATNIQAFVANVDIMFNGTTTNTCDTAVTTINDNFDSYSAGSGQPMPECWTAVGAFAFNGVRNTDGQANSGTNYVFGYSFFTSSGYAYFISPKLSSINDMHQANFYLKGTGQTGTLVNFEYGTLADPTDVNGFTAFGDMQTTSADYVNFETGPAPNNSDMYFALRFTITEQHTSIYLDDFKWESVTLSTNSFESLQDSITLYPNPSVDKHVYIAFNSNALTDGKITIYGITGKKVYEQAITTNPRNTQTLDLSNLSGGIYMVKIVSGTQSITKKLILK